MQPNHCQIIKTLQYLFLNKQLDPFLLLIQTHILPLINSQNSLPQSIIKLTKLNLLQKYYQIKELISKLDQLEAKVQESLEGWKVNKIDKGAIIAVKVQQTRIQLRYQALLQTNIQNLCIMIYQTELYKEWVPFCTQSKQIQQLSSLQKVVEMRFKMPFLTQRFAYLYGMAIDRIQSHGKIYIYGKGITNNQQLITKELKVPKKQYQQKLKSSVALDINHFICVISLHSPQKFSFKVYGYLDSHMPQLPSSIVNYIIKQLGGYIFDKIVKRANNFKDTLWQRQIKENQLKGDKKDRFYQWLAKRIKEWGGNQKIGKVVGGINQVKPKI